MQRCLSELAVLTRSNTKVTDWPHLTNQQPAAEGEGGI